MRVFLAIGFAGIFGIYLLCIELKQGFKRIILSTNDNESIKNRVLRKIRKDFALK